MRRLFYSSPVDARDLAAWGPLAKTLERTGAGALPGDVEVTVGDAPVWPPEGDVAELLIELEELRLDREVRFELWSAIEHHAILAVTLGSGIRRAERRALERGLEKTLRGETLLRTVEGAYEEDRALVFGYALPVASDAAARADLDHLLAPIDPPLYLAERWLIQKRDESLDTASFEAIREPAPGLVAFRPRRDGSSRREEAEERLWRQCGHGEGLIACAPHDPALGELVRRFHRRQDLRVFLVEEPSPRLRVTVDRASVDSAWKGTEGEPGGLVVVSTPDGPPAIDTPPLFMI